VRPLLRLTDLRTTDPAGAALRAADRAAGPAAPPPPAVAARLGELATLRRVPLRYLVPGLAMLPPESVRFFHIDQSWTAALRRGALSVGAPPDGVEPGAEDTGSLPDPCGIVVRSAFVGKYAGLTVRAWTGQIPEDADPDTVAGAQRVAPARLDILGGTVLIAVFPVVPDLVVVEEPHGLVPHGVRRADDGTPVVWLRRADGTLVEVGGQPVPVPVPFRGDAADGVLDVAALAAALQGAAVDHPIPTPVTSAVLAGQTLRPPLRRRFRRAGGA
jgi:hypothetical protein